MLHCRRGQGAFCNGSLIRVSSADRLKDSLLSVGTVPADGNWRTPLSGRCAPCTMPARMSAAPGCASLDLCWVACGRLDGYVELSLQPWDYAAGRLLVEEAGGRVTAPDGSPLSLCQGGPLLASNDKLHAVLQSLLK